MSTETIATETLTEFHGNQEFDADGSGPDIGPSADLSGLEVNLFRMFNYDKFRLGHVWTVKGGMPPGGAMGQQFFCHAFRNDDRPDSELEDDLLKMALAQGAIDRGVRR